ncbi:outer membrane protein [Legionella brunensis]|uniref:Opacity protein-like surface antigen n=1 Tax=Legionella brunensis TaxID=29422 RepID=A0A0W0SEE7_9GAMM|nr:outer membrane beta-barrel protein [Legionella brunensis]KTC81476.1 opacity protein-like surface antigen [Legionella brunensis]
MNKFLKFTLAGLVATSSSSFASLPPDGWYFGLFGIASYIPTSDFTLTGSQFTTLYNNINNYNNNLPANASVVPLPTNANGEIKYQFGGGLGGQFGYRWCGFRFEGELLWDYNTYKNITIDGLSFGRNQQTITSQTSTGVTITSVTSPYSMSGHAQVLGGLFNILYDFYNHEAQDVTWMPYIGAGIGFANIKNDWIININQLNPSTGVYGFFPVLDVTNSESTPIAQAIVGFDYQMDDYFSVGMDYRYLMSKQLNNLNDRFTFHTLNFNFNYWFNG